MPCYTTPVNDRLFIPSTPKSQNVPYKNMTENIYQGEINPRYDNTILEGNSRFAPSTTAPWLAISEDDARIIGIADLKSNIVPGTGTNIVLARSTSSTILTIQNGGEATGNGTFNHGETITTDSPLCMIKELDESGKVLKLSAIKSGSLINTPEVVKHPDGSYYLFIRARDNISVYNPVVPDVSGNLPPLVKAWDDIDVPIIGNEWLFIIKYSSELVPQAMTAIVAPVYAHQDQKIDSEGNLILLGYGFINVSYSLQFFEPANSGTALIEKVSYNTNNNTFFVSVAKLDKDMNLLWYTTTKKDNITGQQIIPSYIDIDNTDNIYVSFKTVLLTTNVDINSTSPNLGTPTLAGFFTSTSAANSAVLVKYDSSGVVTWVIKNDTERVFGDANNKTISVVVDSVNNLIYFSYTSIITSAGDHYINDKYTPTGGDFGNSTLIGKIPNQIPESGSFFTNYHTLLQYNTDGVLQWLTVVAGISDSGNDALVVTNSPLITIPTGTVTSYSISSQGNNSAVIYKKATPSDVVNEYFPLIVDSRLDVQPTRSRSIVVNRSLDGTNNWISKYDSCIITSNMIDSELNIYILLVPENTGIDIYNSEVPDHTGGTINPYLVGNISDDGLYMLASLSIDPYGNVRWARKFTSTQYLKSYCFIVHNQPVFYSTGQMDANDNFFISNIITPESNSTFMPPDPLGYGYVYSSTRVTYTAIFSTGTTTNNVVRSNYYLLPPTTKNKFIYNNSHIDAIVHGRVNNLGVVVNKMILAGGSSINLVRIPGEYHSDTWVVSNKNGVVDFV